MIQVERCRRKVESPVEENRNEELSKEAAETETTETAAEEQAAAEDTQEAAAEPEEKDDASSEEEDSKKKGFYLPQNESLFKPVFKTDYYHRQLYFSCNDAFLENPENITNYIYHLLSDL